MAIQKIQEGITGEQAAELIYNNDMEAASSEVAPERTTFAKVGKNLFNKNDVTDNTLLNYADGTESVNADWVTSKFIAIREGVFYTRSHNSPIAFYDANYEHVSGFPANTIAVQSPATAVFAKISVSKTEVNVYQLEEGQAATEYEPYGIEIPDLILPESVTNPVITPEKTTFLRASKNLFNKNDVTAGVIVSHTDGTESVNANWATSKFIAIKSNQTYKRSNSAPVAIYDSAFEFISGHPANVIPFTTGENARYIKISVLNTQLNVFQFQEGSETTEYESFTSAYPAGLIITEESLAESYKTEQDTKIQNAFNEGAIARRSELSSRLSPFANKYPSNITHLLGADDDAERFDFIFSSSPSGVVGTSDNANYWINEGQGYNLALSAAGTVRLVANPINPIPIPITAVVGLAVFIPDPSAITNLVVEMYMNSTLTPVWIREYKQPLEVGWNIIRHHVIPRRAGYGLEILDPWGTEIHRIRLLPVFSKASNITIGAVWLENPPKAQLLFVDDGGYDTFLEIGYPALKSRGIPTTWALNPAILGTGARITEADVDELSLDLESAFSFHSWASQPTENMTPKEFAEDATRCVRWLRKKGLVGDSIWRAAVVQNLATNHQAQEGIVDASRTYDAAYGFDTFPFLDRWNIPRNQLHGGTNLDDFFELMRRTNSLAVVYTHGIIEGSVYDVTPQRWAEFLTKIDQALGEGWLEGVTYESLNRKMVTKERPLYLDSLEEATKNK